MDARFPVSGVIHAADCQPRHNRPATGKESILFRPAPRISHHPNVRAAVSRYISPPHGPFTSPRHITAPITISPKCRVPYPSRGGRGKYGCSIFWNAHISGWPTPPVFWACCCFCSSVIFFFFTESGEEGSARADTGSPSVWLFPATHSCWHMGDHVLQNWSGEALRDGTMWVGYVRGYIRRYFDVKAHIGPWCGALPRVTRFGIMDHGAGVLSVPDSRGWTLLGRIRLNRARKGSFQCLR